MQVFSISEFSDYCIREKPSRFIYSTENQQHDEYKNLRVSLKFDQLIIGKTAGRICFKNSCDKMMVENVIRVVVGNSMPCVGTVFSIVTQNNAGQDAGETEETTWIME